jgi:hypothetical protein
MKNKLFGLWVLLLVFGIPSLSYGGEIKLLIPEYEEEETSSRHGKSLVVHMKTASDGKPIIRKKVRTICRRF